MRIGGVTRSGPRHWLLSLSVTLPRCVCVIACASVSLLTLSPRPSGRATISQVTWPWPVCLVTSAAGMRVSGLCGCVLPLPGHTWQQVAPVVARTLPGAATSPWLATFTPLLFLSLPLAPAMHPSRASWQPVPGLLPAQRPSGGGLITCSTYFPTRASPGLTLSSFPAICHPFPVSLVSSLSHRGDTPCRFE